MRIHFVHARRAKPLPVVILTLFWATTILTVSVGWHGVGFGATPCCGHPWSMPVSGSDVVLVQLPLVELRGLPFCCLWHDVLPNSLHSVACGALNVLRCNLMLGFFLCFMCFHASTRCIAPQEYGFRSAFSHNWITVFAPISHINRLNFF